jgi:hypothetical protein
VFQAKVPLDCLGPGHDNNCTNCVDCVGAGHVPVVQYTSAQMAVGATQTFTVAGGGGGPYLWSITAGKGTLSGGSGSTIVYTAPATNANCTGNPTLRVKDYCGNTKDTKLAINAYSGPESAVTQTGVQGICVPPGASYCDGSTNVGTGCTYQCCSNLYDCASAYQGKSSSANCNGNWYEPYACNDSPANCCGKCGADCKTNCGPTAYLDSRDPTMKGLGCCPALLL